MYNPAEAQAAVEFALGYEMMRAFLRDEIARCGEVELARVLRVRRRTLARFMAGLDPGKRLFDAAAELAKDRPAPDVVAPEAVALTLLADTFPPERRIEVRRALADALRSVLEREGRKVP